jgi:hypothetical protein
MTWKPIDIAPRDGSRLIVAFRSPMSGACSAFVSVWSDSAWQRESTRGDLEPSGDVAFAWIELPEDAAA